MTLDTRPGWCFIAFSPAPRWHHHLMCMEDVPTTDDLDDLVRRLGLREEWDNAFQHRTYLYLAHFEATKAGDTELAGEMLELDRATFGVIKRDGGRPVVHYSDEPAPDVVPVLPQKLWPEYRCRVMVATEWHQVEVGSVAFRFDGPDPQWTYIHSHVIKRGHGRPGTGELARNIESAAEDWIEQRDGWIGRRSEEAPLNEGVARLIASPPGGFVFGKTSWGDILLDREFAYGMAQAARLVQENLSYAELAYRMPRGGWLVKSVIDNHFEEEYDEDEDDEPDIYSKSDEPTIRKWMFAEDAWPWLVSYDHQAVLPGSLPVEAETEAIPTTLDGVGLIWTNADEVIEALAGSDTRVERDDRLVDQAMGPLRVTSTWSEHVRPAWECICGRSEGRGCSEHPGPTRNGKECPACGTDQLVPISYGYPAFDFVSATDVVVGGCMIGSADRSCRACGTEFDRDAWKRSSFRETSTTVARTAVPPLERGLTALYLAAVTEFDAPLGLDAAQLDAILPHGLICGGWWRRIAGLTAGCTCRGEVTAPADLSVYSIRRNGELTIDIGSEWANDSVGILHGVSLDEPSGSILVRRPDGEVVAIEGLDSTGDVLNRLTEHFGVSPTRRIRAERPAP